MILSYDIILENLGRIDRQTENREQRTENRQRTEKPITDASLIMMDHYIERANIVIIIRKII